MPVAHLPVEIINSVLENLDGTTDRASLAAILRSSRALHILAGPVLYKAVTFRLGYSRHPPAVANFHRTVTGPNVTYAALVQSFTIAIYHPNTPDGVAPRNLVNEILWKLVNLRKLIYEDGGYRVNLPSALTTGPPPFALQQLTCRYRPFEFNHFLSMIRIHKSLVHLEVPYTVRKIEWPPEGPQRIHTLDASAQFTESLPTEGTLLHWKTFIDPEMPTDRLKNIVQRVRVFSIMGPWSEAFALAAHMPELEYFEIDPFTSGGPSVLDSVLQLPSVSLHTLRFLGLELLDAHHDSVQRVFDSFPSLHYIETCEDGMGKWQRWNRGASQAAIYEASVHFLYGIRYGWMEYIHNYCT